jgi:hypothetical protein
LEDNAASGPTPASANLEAGLKTSNSLDFFRDNRTENPRVGVSIPPLGATHLSQIKQSVFERTKLDFGVHFRMPDGDKPFRAKSMAYGVVQNLLRDDCGILFHLLFAYFGTSVHATQRCLLGVEWAGPTG